MAQKMSKNSMRLNYKYNTRSLRENGDMSLQSIMFGQQCPTLADLTSIKLAKYITIDANNCVQGGTAEELIVNYIHPLFLKAKSAVSREDNPNWREAPTEVFDDNYWKEMKVKISNLEYMGAWGVVD